MEEKPNAALVVMQRHALVLNGNLNSEVSNNHRLVGDLFESVQLQHRLKREIHELDCAIAMLQQTTLDKGSVNNA